MKILLCTGRYFMGGIEKYVHDLCINLSDKNIEVVLLIFYKIKNEEIQLIKDKNIAVYELNGRNGRDLKMINQFYILVKEIKPSIIHLNVIPILSFLPLIFFQGKIILTIHQLDSNRYTNILFNRIINGVIYLSKNIEAYYKNLNYLPKATSKIISNGVTVFNKNQYNAPKEIINLIMVSRLAQDKQPHIALEILDYLVHNSKNKYHLTLVGDGDVNDINYVNEIKKSVINRTLTSNVTFEGWQKDVLPSLIKAHGFLMLSRRECFPYNVLEAMSVGIPIFSFNVEGGLIDMHQNNFTGIMINSNEAIALAKEIDAVFSSNRWQTYSENAYQNAKQFSVPKMTEKTLEFYYRLLKQ
ncbi:glycosyltransferase [Flavobacterium sp. RSP49]|uniref:glycosyltransferase n=1 Tax=Flavobacterium sp. RSP49 TaxID=2497487 RepID=UPI000F8178A5|nr:glycosyltransferase [Flavobacterium sp. RSP49]RTZ00896.1 glycosyltransferase [Flavobacterium sp. RSP49]